MGTGASASRQQWTAADEDNTAVEDVRPRTAANANLPINDMTGMTKLVEAKNSGYTYSYFYFYLHDCHTSV